MTEPRQKPKHLTAQALYEASLALSDEERVKLSIMLEQSPVSFDDWFATPEIAQAWREEIDRRIKEIDEGKSGWVDADEVFRKARAILDNPSQ
jgi:hypothetical protein